MRSMLLLFAFITGYVVAVETAHLVASPKSPQPGDPVSLTCWRSVGGVVFGYEQFEWSIVRQETNRVYFERITCVFLTCSIHDDCVQHFRITNCTSTREYVTIIIESADLNLLNGTRWMCKLGEDHSNVVTFNANVSDPVLYVTFLNATTTTLSAEEGEVITLVCVVKPSKKTTDITWQVGEQAITGNISTEHLWSGYQTTVGTLRLTAMWQNNLQSISCVGHQASKAVQSDSLQLVVQVPLATVTTSMSDTEQSDVQVRCETNPTAPPSKVLWMRGNTSIQDNVETVTFVKNGKTVTMSVLTAACNGETQHVYCMGLYGDQTRTSLRDIVIMCPSNMNMAPMMCYGGGAGVGVALALVLLAAGFACLSCRSKHKHVSGDDDHAATNVLYITPQFEHQEQNGGAVYDECSPPARSYEKMDPATRDVHVDRTYDELRVYEKMQ